jgi:hypothetical protein
MLQGLPMHATFIKNASVVKSEPEKKLMDGIIKNSLSDFQRKGVDGLLKGGMPSHSEKPSGHKADVMPSGKAPATKKVDGKMPYPGAKAPK